MSKQEIEYQINKAIVSHSTWKVRLRKAINTGSSEFEVDFVRSPHNCEFGKWLMADKAVLESYPAYDMVVNYHQLLHEETAKVMEMALAGKSEEASYAIQSGSKFASISSKLTITMMTWKKNV